MASTTFGTDFNTGSTDGIGFVNDNPYARICCKADAAVTQSNVLNTGYNPTDGASDTQQDGQSTVTLDIGGGSKLLLSLEL